MYKNKKDTIINMYNKKERNRIIQKLYGLLQLFP